MSDKTSKSEASGQPKDGLVTFEEQSTRQKCNAWKLVSQRIPLLK